MLEYDLLLMSLVIFVPAAFSLLTLLFPASKKEAIRWFALIGTAATLILSLCLLTDYYALLDSRPENGVRAKHSMKLTLNERADEALRRTYNGERNPPLADDWVASVPWIARFDINYAIGIDGISLPLILLTTIIMFFGVLASWTIEKNLKAYFALLLLLETGVLGTFFAMDFFLLYVFYEVMLIPMYFLIGMWGGARRKYAAMKFVLYTIVGSVFLLVAMIGMYFTDVRDFVDSNIVDDRAAEVLAENPRLKATDAQIEKKDNLRFKYDEAARTYNTFSIPILQRAGQAAMLHLNGKTSAIAPKDEGGDGKIELLGRGVKPQEAIGRYKQPFFQSTYQYIFFALLFIGFAVKVPVVPLHSWLPDAHVEAPTPISMILAGVLLKLGGYGIIRLAYPICPWAAHELAMVIGVLGAFAIIYGAFVALGQSDFKRLLAYSSVSHMGYVILGIAVWSSGAQSQYWSWGLNGAMYQMLAHGITSSAMFFIVGVVYERAHHREINKLGGLMSSMPLFGGLSAILFFASMGLPGLCGFVGEVFVVLGTWRFHPGLAITAILATVITAAYLLWTWQRAFWGKTNDDTVTYPDVTLREAIVLVSFVILAVSLGVFPQMLVLNWMEPSVTAQVETLARLTP